MAEITPKAGAESEQSTVKGKDRRKARGMIAEMAAAESLEQKGYRLLERNWRCRTGEIDVVAMDGEVIVFVEVRSRRESGHFGVAVEAVTPRKCMQVRRTAEVYLQHIGRQGCSVRFDVAAVTFGPGDVITEIKHLCGAF